MTDRIPRCAWEYGINCHAPATTIVDVEHHGAPIDFDLIFCDDHAAQADELVRPGWHIVDRRPITTDTHIRRKPRRPRAQEIPA